MWSEFLADYNRAIIEFCDSNETVERELIKVGDEGDGK